MVAGGDHFCARPGRISRCRSVRGRNARPLNKQIKVARCDFNSAQAFRPGKTGRKGKPAKSHAATLPPKLSDLGISKLQRCERKKKFGSQAATQTN